MAASHGIAQSLLDVPLALRLAFERTWRQSLQAWVTVPSGILVILVACFGVDKLLKIGSVSFPASVACLVVLFLGLLLSERTLGEHRTRRIVAAIEVPGQWSLRWINIMFTPSFVLLPLSPAIGVEEVFKIIAVFIIGYVAMMALAAYSTRGLQKLFGSSKRALIERAEETGQDHELLPMSNAQGQETPTAGDASQTPGSGAMTPADGTLSPADGTMTPVGTSRATSTINLLDFPSPSRAYAAPTSGAFAPELTGNAELNAASPMPLQQPPSPPRSRQLAVIITAHKDLITYASLFLFVGLPVFYVTGYAMPVQLTFGILTFFGAMSLPAAWRQYLHPVLVSALFTVLGLWVIGLTRGENLESSLHQFKTGANYLSLWEGGHGLPGAGDVFSSVLDAAIVALALPMYQYRRELQQHFLSIIIPNVVMAIASLFVYPYVCYNIGISATRALSFSTRSLTLALALPATANLGGDTNSAAALAIMSGIMGVLVGLRILAWLRIPEDDYVTRGVTLGANSSAIVTALLLRTDPRAAALSSLSMSVFGAITVLFTSIPPIAHAVMSLVDR